MALTLLVRTARASASSLEAIRQGIAAYSSRIAVAGAQTMEAHLRRQLSRPELAATVSMLVAVMATGLVALGLFGLLSFVVQQNARELGIRVALGAGPERLHREVISRAMKLTVTGLAAGTMLWMPLRPFINSRVKGVL